jgi:hypothetical protein
MEGKMEIKNLKGKVVIELSELEYNDLIEKTNGIDRVLSTMLEMQDLWLSDVGKIESLKYSLLHLLSLEWSSEAYRYVPKEEAAALKIKRKKRLKKGATK